MYYCIGSKCYIKKFMIGKVFVYKVYGKIWVIVLGEIVVGLKGMKLVFVEISGKNNFYVDNVIR